MSKKYFVLLLLLCFFLIGCRTKHVGPENGFVWYKIKENGLYGAIDKYDNVLLPCKFQSIELSNDWKNGNKYNDYEWQLKWNVIDKHDKDLEIRLYIYDDGWRYYSLYDKKSQKSAIADRSYNIIIPFSTCKIESTYGTKDARCLYHVDWATCITNCHLFYQYKLFDEVKRGLYTENGTPIISLERGYSSIFPCCTSNRCWYLCKCNTETVVCDSHGTEICRFNTDGCKGYSKFNDYGNRHKLPKNIEKYKWMGAMDYYYPIAYDAEKGFTCFYEVCDQDGYPIYDSDGERIYKLHHTGIKLSSNSSSFDVKPSGNNEPARTINLRTYTQRSGSVYP